MPPRHPLPLPLIPQHLGRHTADPPTHPLLQTRPKIRQLTPGLDPLALEVLLAPFALQTLVAQQVADRLLAGADGLVPRALAAVGVVARGGAGGGEREGPGFGGRLGGGVFVGGVRAGLVGFGLRGGKGEEWRQ